MKTYVPSWLPVKFGAPHIYTSCKTRFWEAEVNAVSEAKTGFNSLILGLFVSFLKRCPEGAKKNHEACLRSPDCKFWIGPEGLFRTCQPCLRSCSVHKTFTFCVFLVIGEGKTGPSQNDNNVPWIQTSTVFWFWMANI